MIKDPIASAEWGYAEDLINKLHQRRTHTARQTRISDISYKVPFFVSVKGEVAKEIMNKLDATTFRFLPEISKINKELGNNSPTIEKLQERFLLGALTVDYLSATLHHLRTQAQASPSKLASSERLSPTTSWIPVIKSRKMCLR